MSEQLKILHVSDVHGAVDKAKQLKEWLETRQEKFDLVLLSGDMSNMPMELGAEPDTPTEAFRQYEEEFNNVVKAIESINSKVYYIPGNHDPPSTYTPSSSPNPPHNIHGQVVTIAPKLLLAGLGGSLPGYIDGKQCWKGYPYNSEDDMKKPLEQLFNPLIADDSPLHHGNQMIVMTHVGPTESSTTILRSYPGKLLNPVVSGSSTLLHWLCKPHLQTNVVMDVHGHTHGSFGQVQLGNIAVLNPGPLMNGRFGIYTLSMLGDQQRWTLTGVEQCII